MNEPQVQTARTRAEVYFGLAHALVEPSPQLGKALTVTAEHGARVLASSACRRAADGLMRQHALDDNILADQFRRVMSPPGRRPLILYESLHRHGRLMGEVAFAVEQRYRSLGIKAAAELPDHASVELTFLGELAEAEANLLATTSVPQTVKQIRCEAEEFMERHAGAWLPQLARTLVDGDAPFYAVVGSWLQGFLDEERAGRQTAAGPAPARPMLLDPATCTLCGLCTGRCRRHALRIREDDNVTELVLSAVRCTGCSHCVAICPQGALQLRRDQQTATAAQYDQRWQMLRQSARLHCPTCNRPTVSQAEIDAICTRLGDLEDAAMARLHQCSQCKTGYV